MLQKILLLCCLFSFFIPSSFALNQKQRNDDFNTLVALITRQYAMLEYKEQNLKNFNFQNHTKTYREKIKGVRNDQEFYNTIRQFMAEFKDSHISLSKPTLGESHLSMLPFIVKPVYSQQSKKYEAIISSVSDKLVNTNELKVGDRLISLNGVSIIKIADEMAKIFPTGTPDALRSIAYRFLTVRVEGINGKIEDGTCVVKYENGEGKLKEVEMDWIDKGGIENIASGALSEVNYTRPLGYHMADGEYRMDLIYSKIFDKKIDCAIKPENQDSSLLIYQNDTNEISSFLIRLETATRPVIIGYLKIPSFSVENPEEIYNIYKKIIRDLQITDGLLLDLRGNPGGNVVFGFQLAGLFTNKELKNIKKSFMVTIDEINLFNKWLQSEMPVAEKEILEDLVHEMLNLYKKNPDKRQLTDYRPLAGINIIKPDPEVNYTKPILAMVDERSVSMAELFTSILQDNGVVEVAGNTTSGGGGSVRSLGVLPYSGIEIRGTVNISRRVNGSFIENKGVIPDYKYRWTKDDLVLNYAPFKKFCIELLLKKIIPQN